MARLSDLKLTYRIFMQAYPYRRVEWRPGSRLAKPVSEARLAVVTTAAFHFPEQPAFDGSARGGDCSYREIASDCDLGRLRMAHKSDAFDHTGIEKDANLALPLDRLREMERDGEVGALAPVHYSLMGSITAPKRLIESTAPEIAAKLAGNRVDAVLLTPVWPMCHQSVGLIQSVLERAGLTTVSISILPEVTERVDPPRVLVVDRPLGYPLGAPNDAGLQTAIIRVALALLTEPPPARRTFAD